MLPNGQKPLRVDESLVRGLKMQSFSRDILLHLMEFIDYEEKVTFMSCCHDWYFNYMKKYIRRLCIRNNNADLFDVAGKVQQLITDPFRQLSFSSDILSIQLLSELNYCCDEINYQEEELFKVMEATDRLKVRKVTIETIMHPEVIVESLQKVVECDEFTLSLSFFLRSEVIPFLPFVKSLSLYLTAGIQEPLSSYARTLQHLNLTDCIIQDVSMLGSIPHLELHYCYNLVDISTLNNNDHIVVQYCNEIQDYSQSFANSRKIEITVAHGSAGAYSFDMTRWTKVEELKIESSHANAPFILKNSNQLPITLKRCHLGGGAIAAIDLTINSNHALHQLKLTEDVSITSLEGRGLEQVAIIELDKMKSLQSLQGLGRGRNRKVVILTCNKVTDFSPLNCISIVEIKCCNGFSDPLQVRSVHDLTLCPMKKTSFLAANSSVTNPYANVHSLTLSNAKYIQDFNGLEKIPIIRLLYQGFNLLRIFLLRGNTLENQKIVFEHYITCKPQNLYNMHDTYMKDLYDYYDQFPKKWVWIRKSCY